MTISHLTLLTDEILKRNNYPADSNMTIPDPLKPLSFFGLLGGAKSPFNADFLAACFGSRIFLEIEAKKQPEPLSDAGSLKYFPAEPFSMTSMGIFSGTGDSLYSDLAGSCEMPY